ncbi:MAG: aminotransferase class III-fold pyridoxal phosphate-dependent enzyme [Planctomycetota bacterium]|nr:aminotransferase class III-fold pyridoxal phosphate-dependent enzyme [Planctomycetota bacterium]
MKSLIATRPTLSASDARRLTAELYGLEVELAPLPSERDQNFRARTADGRSFVLKIANAAEERANLELQHAVIERAAGLGVPEPVPTQAGATIAEASGHLVRLMTWLPGVPLASVKPHTGELLHSLGAHLGRIARALAGFDHPAAREDFHWDVANAREVVEREIGGLAGERRELVESFVPRFPELGALRRAVIHGDANDHNVLVSELGPELDPAAHRARRVTGLIDFGDVVRSHVVCEPAVGAAYALFGKPDPVAAAAAVIGGFHAAYPLDEAELDVLFDLIVARLCVSVCLSAKQRAERPEDEYLSISEPDAWAALERLREVHPRYALAAFRHACGLEPCARGAAVGAWLEKNPERIGPLVEAERLDGPTIVFDFSVASREWTSFEAGSEGDAIESRMTAAGALLGIGRYAEPRLAYVGDGYADEGNEGPERRTVHLGLDLFMEAGAPIFAPLDGEVHSFADNDRPFDYGPTVLLRHATDDGDPFFTLYGHLSRESLAGLAVGASVARGTKLAELGDPSVNGGWAPHLHFQLIADDLGFEGDYPGVASPEKWGIWSSFSPDPNLIARIAGATPYDPGPDAGELVELRKRLLGPSLSLSYRRPLHIVRGRGQHLIDARGRPYLDAVNNVQHVGHAHPRVVRAAREQMALLETNTRTLHPNILRYAERLTALLPDPLSVCFFVCSGSEANELALRLVRAHTGRKGVVVLDGAYHGNTGELVGLSPYKLDGPGGPGVIGRPDHARVAAMPDPYRGPHVNGAAYAESVRAAAEELRSSAHGLAAFLCEPLLGCGGQIVPPPGYLDLAFRAVRAAGGLCIADEVQIGFGRVGTHLWGFELQDVVPDVVTLGKPIGNGHPLGAVVTTPEIAASFASGMEYFNTCGGNPVSCAVGLAVLDVIRDEGLQENARVVGARLLEGLEELRSRHPIVGDVRGAGLFLGVELVRDRATLEPAPAEAAYVAERMKERGILIGVDGPLQNVLKIKPPLVFTAEDAERLVAELDRILVEDAVARGARKKNP